MSLYTAIDEILGLAQQIQGFVQTLLEADGFTDEQWSYLEPLEQATHPLTTILTELQADVQLVPDSQVVSVLAMDCRAPLSILLGYSQLFLMDTNGAMSDHLRSIFQHIFELAMTVLEIINDLLDEAHANQTEQ